MTTTTLNAQTVGLGNTPPAPLGATPGNTPGVTPGGAMGALPDWMRTLIDQIAKLDSARSDDGVVDQNGAPTLETPIFDFSGDQLALLLAAMDTKIKDLQAKTAREGIEVARVQTETANTDMLEKLQEAIDEQAEAAAKEKENKVWGWIAKVAAFIGAIVAVVAAAAATVATGGAAAPLLIVAVIGAVAATVDLANQINQEVNPDAEPFTLGSLIGDAIIQAMDDEGIDGTDRAAASGLASAMGFLLMQPDLAGQMAEDAAIADGRSPEFAANMRMGVTIAAVVTTVIAMIVVTIASGGAASGTTASSAASGTSKAVDVGAKVADTTADVITAADKVKKASDAAQQVIKASKYIGAINGLAQGTAAIGGGITSIQVAENQQQAENARAAAKEIEAMLLKLQEQTEEQTTRLKEIIAALQEGMTMFTNMIAAAGDQRANMIRNQVRA